MDTVRQAFHGVSVRRVNLNDQIADRIQSMIETRELKAGVCLPAERELATSFGVNRATIREAVHILRHRGLVTMRPGSGAYVTQIEPETVAETFANYFTSRDVPAEDLQALRVAIEPEIAFHAANRAGKDDIERLNQCMARLEGCWEHGTRQETALADVAFHLALAAATHNDLFVAVANGLGAILTRKLATRYRTHRAPTGLARHRKILEALAAGDAEAARAAMRKHMEVTDVSKDS